MSLAIFQKITFIQKQAQVLLYSHFNFFWRCHIWKTIQPFLVNTINQNDNIPIDFYSVHLHFNNIFCSWFFIIWPTLFGCITKHSSINISEWFLSNLMKTVHTHTIRQNYEEMTCTVNCNSSRFCFRTACSVWNRAGFPVEKKSSENAYVINIVVYTTTI